MLENSKQFLRNFTQTTPFVLSNTVTLIPYVLFLGLSDSHQPLSILPFVLFYTFRMTGLFLVRGIKFGINSFTLLMLSLLTGGTGSFLGVIGPLHFPCQVISAVLLGLSAAWLTPANLTVDYSEKQAGFVNMTAKKYPYAVCLLLMLFIVVRSSGSSGNSFLMAVYTLFYGAAYHTVSHYPNYELNFKEIKTGLVVTKELVLFIVFFVLLLLLRSGRLLQKLKDVDLAIIGFACAFMVAVVFVRRSYPIWQLPLWLNLLTFLSRMCGNFLFLFGSIYVGGTTGFDQIAIHLYLPYAVGMILALLFMQKLLSAFSYCHPIVIFLAGLSLGLSVLLIPRLSLLSWLMISFFRSGLNSWLNKSYCETSEIAADQRMLVKFTTQNKGNLTHQFLLMIMILLTIRATNQSDHLFLALISKTTVSSSVILVLNVLKWGSIGIFLILFVIVFRIWKKSEEKNWNS